MAQEQSTEERIKALRQKRREINDELKTLLPPPKPKKSQRCEQTEDWVDKQVIADIVAKTPF